MTDRPINWLALFVASGLLALPCSAPALAAPGQRVTLESLLSEMVDDDAPARWPAPEFTCRQASSYDRAKMAPDKPGWFANNDHSQYLRTEEVDGHRRYVLMDADGPGCIVRFWLTSGGAKRGELRIYLDGAQEPALRFSAFDLMSGGLAAGPSLLLPHPGYNAKGTGGNTLYLPIPYARHCLVTWEEADVRSQAARYYQINYRQYAKDTQVESYSASAMEKAQAVLARANEYLAHPPSAVAGHMSSRQASIPASGEVSVDLPEGPHAVRRLELRLDAPKERLEQVLRSTIVKLEFDGEPTAWCPAGDFFGSGVGVNELQSWYRTVEKDGTMICRWVMPYRKSGRITLQNVGSVPVQATLTATTNDWQWDDHSMYFHANWRLQADISVPPPIDWNYIGIEGKGVYVGDTLALYNPVATWYGEGDEKIRVDGESFPSHVGTGTEDYYNYSYAPKGIMQTPFANQVRVGPKMTQGHNTLTRTRNLDAIPFQRSLDFDLEIMPWKPTKVTYAATTYWYAFAGARSNRGPMPQEKARVAGSGAVRDAKNAPRPEPVQFAAVTAQAADDIVIADFEGDTYGNWKVTGNCFGTGPCHGTLPNQQNVSGFQGKGLVNTYLNRDSTTGTLTSPPFTIEHKFINFLIGGGNKPDAACINLLIDGKVVRTASGRDNELLQWTTWDVANLAGKTATIQIVDQATDGWGHINIDQIAQSNARKEESSVPKKPYHETYRPQFHFTARKNWLNDPNGLVFYKGEYHLFFQHNPSGINWGNMTWGHAVSPDLVHWTQLEHALHPDKLGTIFSGSAVVDWDNTTGFQTGDEKVIVCVYTSAGKPFTQSIAYSNDRGRTWTKYDKNPVLKHVIGGNRDPKVFWHTPTKKWVMSLFLDRGKYGLFGSQNLKEWTKLSDFAPFGADECPDMFELPVDGDAQNTRWVFWGGNSNYLIGKFDGTTFTTEAGPFRFEFGNNYYAAQSYSDIPKEDGRRIQIAWMRGGTYPAMPFNQQMSFPSAITLQTLPEGIRLCREPVGEIEKIHGKQHSYKDIALKPGVNPLKDIVGDLFDIRLEFEPGDAEEVTLNIRGTPVVYDVKRKQVVFLGKTAKLEPIQGKVKLRVLVDRTSIEVFGADGRFSMSSCFLPPSGDKKISLSAKDGTAQVKSLEVWQLRSAWPE